MYWRIEMCRLGCGDAVVSEGNPTPTPTIVTAGSVRIWDFALGQLRHHHQDLSAEVDCEAFCEGVKEYINCQSRLVNMEDALCKDLFAEQLIDKHYINKAHFDHVS